MSRIVGYLRKLAIVCAVVAAGAVWAKTFRSSLTHTEWKGLWFVPSATEGKAVETVERNIEIREKLVERERRLRKQRMGELGLKDTLHGVERQVLGAKSDLRGDDIEAILEPLPPGYRDYTTREACMQQKLQFPEDFGRLDCFSEAYDGDIPWLDSDSSTDSDIPLEEDN